LFLHIGRAEVHFLVGPDLPVHD
jgi:hypothetical protein